KEQWPKIENAISQTLDLLIDFGFSKETLASHNSIIIIAYFMLKGGNIKSAESTNNIHKYLLYAHLKNIYGGQGDQIIGALRNVLRVRIDEEKRKYKLADTIFPLEGKLNTKLAANKSLRLEKEDIAEYRKTKLGYTSFYILSL